MQVEIELRQMRYFLAVAEERNFTRAAKRCHVAQPSLSKQIHEIESSLGARLFDRLPRDVRLTDAGRIFEKEVARALEHSCRAVSLVRALQHQQKQALRIGVSMSCDLPRIHGLILTAQKSEHGSSIDHVSGSSPELLLRLLRGSLDLAVMDLPVQDPEITALPIHAEPLLAWLPQRHPLLERPMVRFFDLKKEHFVLLQERVDPGSTTVRATLLEAGFEASVTHWVSSLIELLDQVGLCGHIGLTRGSAGRLRREGLLSKPLHHPLRLETAIVWHSDNRNPVMLSFRDALIAFSQLTSTRPAA